MENNISTNGRKGFTFPEGFEAPVGYLTIKIIEGLINNRHIIAETGKNSFNFVIRNRNKIKKSIDFVSSLVNDKEI